MSLLNVMVETRIYIYIYIYPPNAKPCEEKKRKDITYTILGSCRISRIPFWDHVGYHVCHFGIM